MDEDGRILRINEGTYSRVLTFGSGSFVGTDTYRPAVRDWVNNGTESSYVWSPEDVTAKIRRRTTEESLAEPTFKLGVYFFRGGNEGLGRKYWEEAQQLFPDSWNYHRQDWNLTEGLGGPKFRAKREALGDKPFYGSLDLPEDR